MEHRTYNPSRMNGGAHDLHVLDRVRRSGAVPARFAQYTMAALQKGSAFSRRGDGIGEEDGGTKGQSEGGEEMCGAHCCCFLKIGLGLCFVCL